MIQLTDTAWVQYDGDAHATVYAVRRSTGRPEPAFTCHSGHVPTLVRKGLRWVLDNQPNVLKPVPRTTDSNPKV